jgi:hypothetical protein
MRNAHKYVALLAVALAAIIGASCAQSDTPNLDQPPKGRLVTKAELGDKWPFTVDSGYVDCPDGLSAIFRTGDAVYGSMGWRLQEALRNQILYGRLIILSQVQRSVLGL